jgi:hypothetical protein
VHEERRLYMTLLRAATSSRMPDYLFDEQKRIAAAVSPDDCSHRAATARGATLTTATGSPRTKDGRACASPGARFSRTSMCS